MRKKLFKKICKMFIKKSQASLFRDAKLQKWIFPSCSTVCLTADSFICWSPNRKFSFLFFQKIFLRGDLSVNKTLFWHSTWIETFEHVLRGCSPAEITTTLLPFTHSGCWLRNFILYLANSVSIREIFHYVSVSKAVCIDQRACSFWCVWPWRVLWETLSLAMMWC